MELERKFIFLIKLFPFASLPSLKGSNFGNFSPFYAGLSYMLLLTAATIIITPTPMAMPVPDILAYIWVHT